MQTHTSLTQQLHTALQETFTLYRATHLAHWNVRGPSFPQLHAMFEAQYTELWAALDTIAERIRAIGSEVHPDVLTGKVTAAGGDAKKTVNDLAQNHRAMAGKLRQMVFAADDDSDPATADLLTQRITAHEQAAWMLEATAQGM